MLAALLALPSPARADAVRDAARLARGIKVLGYDPLWFDPAKARFQPRHFARIRAGGFSHIRMPMFGFAHMDADNRLDPRWLVTLDRMVADATASGLAVILDEHDFNACGRDLPACRSRLLAFWQQVALRFRSAPDTVLFEILNEPNRAVTPDAWNALLAEALAAIRQTNPARTVVIGPGNSNSYRSLPALELPEADRNIVVTVHYYEPSAFTYQGAGWANPGRENDVGRNWGAEAERAAVGAAFDQVAAWGRVHNRPMHLGEFGAYDKGPAGSRAEWTAAVARAAEARGMSWSYWQFDHDFLAYDMARDDWIAPIHDALVPW